MLAQHLTAAGGHATQTVPSQRPAAQASEDALLDEPTLANLEELGDRDFLACIFRLYVAQAPQALAELDAALASGDALALSRAAHSLKSMSANIGAVQLKDRVGAIERAARDGHPAGGLASLADAVSGLSPLLVRTLDALRLRLEMPDEDAQGGEATTGGRRAVG